MFIHVNVLHTQKKLIFATKQPTNSSTLTQQSITRGTQEHKLQTTRRQREKVQLFQLRQYVVEKRNLPREKQHKNIKSIKNKRKNHKDHKNSHHREQ